MTKPHVLEPEQLPFMVQRVGPIALSSAVAAAVLTSVAVVNGEALFALLGFVQLIAISPVAAWLARVAWEKERYELHPTHILVRSGGLWSDRTIELELQNVTHVRQRLPWLRYRFSGVGDVIVESAGSSSSEVVLRSVRDPDAIYAFLREQMKRSGFSLKGGRVLHQEAPDLLGAAMESVVGFGFGAMVSFYALGEFGQTLAEGTADVTTVLSGLFGLGATGATLVAPVLHFLDLKHRTYTVHEDVVVYQEGFLNRDNAFIPYENIADANSTRTFLDRILGLYDVKVSCQGTGSEVSFRRLRRGEELSAVLREVLRGAERARREAEETARSVATGGHGGPRRRHVAPEEAWTAELGVNTMRALVGTLWLLPLLPVWMVVATLGALRANATRYEVSGDAVSMRYKLVTEQRVSFAWDKITGVIERTTPLDLLLGTTTIRFWSIGAGQPLDLAHVDRRAVDVAALRRQAGIADGAPAVTLPADFDPIAWTTSRIPLLIAAGLATLAVVVVAALHTTTWLVLLAPIFGGVLGNAAVAWVRAGKQILALHDDHVELITGSLFREHATVHFEHVKKTEAVTWFGSACGQLTLHVAGEIVTEARKGQKIIRPCTLVARFLPEVDALRPALDEVLQGRRAAADVQQPVEAPVVELEVAPDPLQLVSGPVLAGLLITAVGVAVLTALPRPDLPLPLELALLPVWAAVLVRFLQIRRLRYRVEPTRVVAGGGLLHRWQVGILFDRIDSLQEDQGGLGKAFGTGTVSILTAGSSTPDLVMAAVRDHRELYRAIRVHYGGGQRLEGGERLGATGG